jgi:hypothetical protein
MDIDVYIDYDLIDYVTIDGIEYELFYGGVVIDGMFVETKDLRYHYIQSINVYDDPTPKKFIDGSDLPVPLIDTPPGGYYNDPFDYRVYYDESEFPRFYDQPRTYMMDAKSEPDLKLQLSFETWLVCVISESFGPSPFLAKDDAYQVAPLLGWTWGYSIDYADNGNGVDDLGDFTVTRETFNWIASPSSNWLAALGQSYGTEQYLDWFNVTLDSCKKCVVPEPASVIGLVALGLPILALRLRARKKLE